MGAVERRLAYKTVAVPQLHSGKLLPVGLHTRAMPRPANNRAAWCGAPPVQCGHITNNVDAAGRHCLAD